MNEIIFPALFGNEKFKETVGRDFAAGRNSHAYIFEGEQGSGRMTAALSCAAALSCERRGDAFPCGKCLSCRKIFGGYSPDVIVVERPIDRKTIGVNAVRAIRDDLWVTPNDGDFRVYIIKEAELMTPEAQNALLISLEEPPPFVVFILLTVSAEKLIETVRSRSTLMRMERFSEERILEFLTQNEDTRAYAAAHPEQARTIAASSLGSPGLALEAVLSKNDAKTAVKKDAFDAHDAADRLCEALIVSNRAGVLDVMRSIPKGSENSRAVIELCISALRDVTVRRSGARSQAMFYTDGDRVSLLAKKASAKRIDKLFRALDEYASLLAQNANETIITTLIATE